MNKQDNEGEKTGGNPYPTYDLETCIKFSNAIKELGGSKGGVKKSILARQLQIAESTPSFFQRLSASKTYGIIDGWGTYGLTDLGRKYFYPTSGNDSKEALLRMFSTPSVFAKLIARYDGDTLPATSILGNVLHQDSSVPDSWKDRVAQMFIRNANFVGIIDQSGILRYDADMHTKSEIAPAEVPQKQPDPLSVPAWMVPTDEAPSGSTVWSYKGGVLSVKTPDPISKDLWDRLNAYVQILKPE